MTSETEIQDYSQTQSLDKVGIFLSALCVIHCLATPFLIILSPWLGSYFDSKWSHLGIFIFIVPVAYFTFYRFYKNHRNKKPMILGTIGIFILGVALLSPGHSWEIAHDELHNHSEEHFNYIDTIINIVGSIILMVGHLMNIKIHRNTKTADDCCHHHP
jgi:hypothetical protein